ncbi:P-loop containing nucleoside triphosphate hydrolase protein [Terfezia claveryi]|nr:P-loop containing nucleoside triphosphate hydrolase protein [Terfezia claveryi]
MASPPTSPIPSHTPPRPMSAMIRPARSASRLSMSSRPGGSRASDEDSKTAVKVAIRVRPALQPNDPGYDLIPQRFQKSAVQVMSPTSLAVDSPQGKKIFVFDRVFSEKVEQDGVWEYLQESVSAFVQGYNVSLLAYGQSGAGKSYTMGTASPGDSPSHGMYWILCAAIRISFNLHVQALFHALRMHYSNT